MVGSTKPEERQLAEGAGFTFEAIPAGKLRRYFSLQNFTDLPRIWAGYRASRRIIAEFQPDVVFGKGSYVALPMVWAASRAGIPVVIHESDTVPGLANRLAAKRAAAVAVSWPPDSIHGLPPQKLVYTGNPLPAAALKGKAARAEQQFKLEKLRPTVLVLGGSQGSRKINELITAALPDLLEEFQVVHQVGDRSVADITAVQQALPAQPRARYHVRGFFNDELFDLYAAASLVVSRAGAGALAAAALAGKPTVLLPLPTAAGDHQRANAQVFAQAGAATVLEEEQLDPAELVRVVKQILHNPQKLTEMGRAAKTLAHPRATEDLAELIWKTGHGTR